MEAKAARHRFVDVMVRHEGERAQGNDRLWPEWQATGAEYWVQKHPELAPYRGSEIRDALAGLAATGQEPAARNATWVLQGLRAHGPLRPNRSGGDSLESRG